MERASAERWMREALEEAQRAETEGEVPVGAIILINEKIVGRGHNHSIRSHDPTAHAEVLALRHAAHSMRNYRLPGSILVVTIEPCLMCVGALIHARVDEIVFVLVNGATGIAVGMSTSIPPHNLGEVIGALVYMLEHWDQLDDISVDDLMRFIQGPDFTTGGVILQVAGDEDLHAAYGSGRGRVTIQAKAHLEERSRGRNRIIVTELPYMTNKASLIERIAELAREERLEGIADLRDESDRQGLRIVIELTDCRSRKSASRPLQKHPHA